MPHLSKNQRNLDSSVQSNAQILNSIQGLRAIAVCLVVFYHSSFWFLKSGFIGVDIFFVLSGFLVTKKLLNSIQKEVYLYGRVSLKKQLSKFYISRFWRLAPAGIVTIFVSLIVSYFFQNSALFASTLKDGLYSIFSLQNLNLLISSRRYFGVDSSNSIFMHFWSLSLEDQFYVLIPVILASALYLNRFLPYSDTKKFYQNIDRKFFSPILLIVTFSLIFSIHLVLSGETSGYFDTRSRFWELGVGSLLALQSKTNSRIILKVNFYLGVSLLIFSLFVIRSVDFFPGWEAILPVGGTILVLMSLINSDESFFGARVLSVRPLIWIGNRSYSIYLVHWPLLSFLKYFKLKPIYNISLFVSLLLIFSSLLYNFVETTFRFRKHLPSLLRLLISFARGVTPRYWYLIISLTCSYFLISNVPSMVYSDATQVSTASASPSNPVVTSSGPLVPSKSTSSIRQNGSNLDSANRNPSENYSKELLQWSQKVEIALKVSSVNGMKPELVSLLSARDEIWKTCMINDVLGRSKCEFGNSQATQKILVIGDSMTRSFIGMVLQNYDLRQAHIYLVVRPGCPVTAISEIQNTSKEYLACHETWKNTLSQLDTLSFSDVFIGSADDNTFTDSRSKVLLVNKGLSEFLSQIKRLSSNLYLFGMPSKQKGLINCVATDGKIQNTCFSKTADYLQIQSIEKAAILSVGGHFWNPNDLFCVRNICPPVIDSTPVFYDGAHATKEIIDKISPLFHLWYLTTT